MTWDRTIDIISIDCASLPTLQERFGFTNSWIRVARVGSAIGKPIDKPKSVFYDPFSRYVYALYGLKPPKTLDLSLTTQPCRGGCFNSTSLKICMKICFFFSQWLNTSQCIDKMLMRFSSNDLSFGTQNEKVKIITIIRSSITSCGVDTRFTPF